MLLWLITNRKKKMYGLEIQKNFIFDNIFPVGFKLLSMVFFNRSEKIVDLWGRSTARYRGPLNGILHHSQRQKMLKFVIL